MKRLITVAAVVACLGLVAESHTVVAANGFLLDHFQCYAVEQLSERVEENNVDVTLLDQFGETEQVAVKPVLLCAPVTKCVGSEYSSCYEPVNPDDHLTCYKLGRTSHVNQDVIVSNQFGSQALKVTTPKVLCVPSEKQLLQEE